MSEKRIARLRELAQAVTYGREAINREFTMRVPADEDRDADCVLTWAADALEQLTADRDRQKKSREHWINQADKLETLARRMWIQINGDDEFFEDAVSGQQSAGDNGK